MNDCPFRRCFYYVARTTTYILVDVVFMAHEHGEWLLINYARSWLDGVRKPQSSLVCSQVTLRIYTIYTHEWAATPASRRPINNSIESRTDPFMEDPQFLVSSRIMT
jgi:hypothetical protein